MHFFKHRGLCLLALGSLIALPALVSPGTVRADEAVPRKAPTMENLMWTLGIQFHGVTDGRTTGESGESSVTEYGDSKSLAFGWGTGFTVPLVINFVNGLGMRFAFSSVFSGEPLFDNALAQISFLTPTVENEQTTWTAPRLYRAREAWLMGGNLVANVHFTFPLLMGAFKPYLGAGPGVFVNYVFTDLERDVNDFALLDNQYNDPYDSGNIDPYSVSMSPGFDGYVGVNFKVQNHMHLNFEVAYDVASMPESALLKATDGSDAKRSAYYYSVVKLSSGLLFNF